MARVELLLAIISLMTTWLRAEKGTNSTRKKESKRDWGAASASLILTNKFDGLTANRYTKSAELQCPL